MRYQVYLSDLNSRTPSSLNIPSIKLLIQKIVFDIFLLGMSGWNKVLIVIKYYGRCAFK
uniref:Uncharacterized protein n=1 Tax=Meloidogyne enterolobii TaxID=390850 RepID=A0A6V7TR33_MELEN|nr:unnamed protein product [Meloidogyne enterolobii]